VTIREGVPEAASSIGLTHHVLYLRSQQGEGAGEHLFGAGHKLFLEPLGVRRESRIVSSAGMEFEVSAEAASIM
jgi:hypothetical protein